jgi:hypothetical protein
MGLGRLLSQWVVEPASRGDYTGAIIFGLLAVFAIVMAVRRATKDTAGSWK